MDIDYDLLASKIVSGLKKGKKLEAGDDEAGEGEDCKPAASGKKKMSDKQKGMLAILISSKKPKKG